MERTDEVRRGRDAYEARTWAEAVEALSAADSSGELEAVDLERLGDALFMVGREAAHYGMWERAHHG